MSLTVIIPPTDVSPTTGTGDAVLATSPTLVTPNLGSASATLLTMSGSVHGANGTVGNPSFAFNSDQDTGLFNIGANNLGVAIGGAKVLDVASTGLTVTGALGASSLTSPAATNLTLGTGTSGAAITVLSASNNVGIGTITPAQLLHVFSTGTVQPIIEGGAAGGWPILEIKHGAGSRWLIENGRTAGMLGFFNATNGGQRAGFTDAGNLVIGTTSETGLTGAGGLKINSSTAGSAGAGALVVTGGLSAGAASYIGGNLTAVGTGTHTFGTTNTVTMAAGAMTLQGVTAVTSGRLRLQSSNTDYGNGVTLLYSSVSPDASARAWQISSNFIANGNLDFLVSASNSTQAINAAISFTSAGGINAAGAVTIGNTVSSVSLTSPNRTITMVVGGVTLYIAAKTTND